MKSLYVLTALAAFNLVAAQKTTELKEFKSLTIGEDMKVKLVKSNSNKIVFNDGGEDDDDALQIQNVNGMLVIGGEDNEFTLYYKDAIEMIVVGSDSDVYGSDEIKTKEFKLVAAEDAVVHLNLNVQKLSTVADADAVVDLTGTATDHNAVLSEDAVLKGINLTTKNTNIQLAPDAAASITANGVVDAVVEEDGSLKIYGNPKTVNKTRGEDASIVVVK